MVGKIIGLIAVSAMLIMFLISFGKGNTNELIFWGVLILINSISLGVIEILERLDEKQIMGMTNKEIKETVEWYMDEIGKDLAEQCTFEKDEEIFYFLDELKKGIDEKIKWYKENKKFPSLWEE